MITMEDGYSEFCRDAILNEIQRVNSDQYIDDQIESHQNQIKKLKESKKSSKGNTGQVREILEFGLEGYINRNSEVLIGASQNRLWIRGSVLPELKKAGSKLSEYDVLKMFEEGNIE